MSWDSLGKKAEKALKEAVREVIEEHRRLGRPLYIWRNGKVAKVSADELFRKKSSKPKAKSR